MIILLNYLSNVYYSSISISEIMPAILLVYDDYSQLSRAQLFAKSHANVVTAYQTFLNSNFHCSASRVGLFDPTSLHELLEYDHIIAVNSEYITNSLAHFEYIASSSARHIGSIQGIYLQLKDIFEDPMNRQRITIINFEYTQSGTNFPHLLDCTSRFSMMEELFEFADQLNLKCKHSPIADVYEQCMWAGLQGGQEVKEAIQQVTKGAIGGELNTMSDSGITTMGTSNPQSQDRDGSQHILSNIIPGDLTNGEIQNHDFSGPADLQNEDFSLDLYNFNGFLYQDICANVEDSPIPMGHSV